MKRNPIVNLMLRVLTICLLVGWMGVIFLFSAQPGDDSGETSGQAAEFICRTVDKVFHLQWSEAEIADRALRIDHPVRKAAHITEYGILGVITFLAVIAWPIRGKKLYALPMIWCVIYASGDEIHQLFVEGRAGRVTDVLWDSAGALIALFITGLIYRAYCRRKSCHKGT